jgi:hypothetical protein
MENENIEMITVDGVQIPKVVHDKIYEDAKKIGEVETHRQHKDVLYNKLGEFAGAQPNVRQKKFDESAEILVNMVKEKFDSLNKATENKVEIDEVEQQINDARVQLETEYKDKIASLESEYNKKLLDRDALNLAIKNNLDMNYKDEFIANFNKFSYSQDPEDTYRFRLNNDPVLTEDRKPAGLEEIVKIIQADKPVFFQTSKAGAGSTNGGIPVQDKEFDRTKNINMQEAFEEAGYFEPFKK